MNDRSRLPASLDDWRRRVDTNGIMEGYRTVQQQAFDTLLGGTSGAKRVAAATTEGGPFSAIRKVRRFDAVLVNRYRTRMSLRLQMLQIARVAQKALGDSACLVRDFLLRQIMAEGGGSDRAGKADLYYTIFVLAGLEALQAEIPVERVLPFVRGFGDGENLDFVHLGALARCRAAIGGAGAPPQAASGTKRTMERAFHHGEILSRLEKYRTRDGGYDVKPGAANGSAYGCFVALGAYQDLGAELREPLRMMQCLKFLETPDGAWGNVRGMRTGTVPATAAAITLLHQLGMPINATAGDWLLDQIHSDGGWLAVPGAPIPDLLSTATALHALSCLDRPLPDAMREKCLDFVDTLWNAEGGFHGHWADDALDAEYTFYGLLALGHLTV